MAFAVLTKNTNLKATMEKLWTDPGGTHSFSFSSRAVEEFYVLDDDAVFDDIDPNDTNQVVAPESTIFTDNAAVASRHKFLVTPSNGDPASIVYVVFENTTKNDDHSPINTLNYALVSDTPLKPGVKYSISRQSGDGTVKYASFSNRILCFARGTLIETATGPVAVEALRCGDRVRTIDRGFQSIGWIGSTSHLWSPAPDRNKPVLFRQGALGAGLPLRDLMLSPQHRLLIPTPKGEVLGPAKAMTGLKGVRQMNGCRRIEYFHIMLARHHVILAEGVPAESCYPGPCTMRRLSTAGRTAVHEILRTWPLEADAATFQSARRLQTVQQTRRHFQTRAHCWSVHDLSAAMAPAPHVPAAASRLPLICETARGAGNAPVLH